MDNVAKYLPCKHCAESIKIEAKVCKHCGKSQGVSVWVWILLTPVVLFAIMMLIGSGADPAKVNARERLSACWDSYENLAKNPGIPTPATDLAYSACHESAREFERKYGYSATIRKN